ncbi:MAG: family N-acetyltransferase [Acidobacteria bacterium]|nr:family N-acetyltransferase [Acidobacteriota bacterium]
MHRTIRRFSGNRLAALSPRAAGAPADPGALLQAVSRAGRTILSDYESKQVLALHDIPCVETCLAHNEDEAVLAAALLGFPVLLKLHSHTLRDDSGGISVVVSDDAGVRQGWQAIREAVIGRHGRQHFLGVTVQPAITSDGREFFVHGESHPNSGPALRYGRDPANRGAANPWSLRELPAAEAIQFEQLLENFRRLLAANPGIREINLQPLIVAGGQLLGLGAKIVLQSSPGQPA